MQTVILAIHIVIAVSLIVLVLLQTGKGAEMGAAFGAGARGRDKWRLPQMCRSRLRRMYRQLTPETNRSKSFFLV